MKKPFYPICRVIFLWQWPLIHPAIFINGTGRFVTKALMILLLTGIGGLAQAQLIISSGGQTGSSGSNWSSTGTNPVVITATGSAHINTSVISGYLNAGVSVIMNNTTVGTNINSDIVKNSGGDASFTVKDISYINIASAVSISSTTGSLNVILWADADNSQGGAVNDFMYLDAGVTISSNGGKIILAGGADDGSNGGFAGDGIPDGFAWNGSNNTSYGANNLGGLNLGPRTGYGTVISLLSGGGDIVLRGATSNNNAYPGISSQASLKIVSGNGKISMFGKSTTGHGVELTFAASPTIAISSASSSVPAIDLKGVTTASGYCGFWASNNANGNILIQSTAASGGGVTIEGTSINSCGVCLATGGSNIISQVLSQAGDIIIKGKATGQYSIVLYGESYLGNRKDANAVNGVVPGVTGSTAGISLQGDDQLLFSNTAGKFCSLSSTGPLNIDAYTPGYNGTLSWGGNVNFGNGFSSISLGKPNVNYQFVINNSLASTGNITAYLNNLYLADGVNLTSSGAGTIGIYTKGNFGTNGSTRRSISTANGNIQVFADFDNDGNGQLDLDYLTLNPGSGTTHLKCRTMNWLTGSATDKPYLNGTGAVIIEPAGTTFQNVDNAFFVFDQDANGMAALTIGKSTNMGNITISNPVTVAGAINLYGGIVTLGSNVTSTATGDIFIKSNLNVNGGFSIVGNAGIYKTGGTGTLTMQSQDRLRSGIIQASGAGKLNVVLWSDFDNNANGGMEVQSISTNGGHFWLGGNSSNGGSYTWNGLTVGNGPSVGSLNNNYNAIDFAGPVNTNGGDVLMWGGNGVGGGLNGIAMTWGASSINSGNGNITLIADAIGINKLTLTSTGKISLVPEGGSYPAPITWSGSMAGSIFNGTNTFSFLNINNFNSLGGLTLGYYDGHLNAGVPVIQNNSSNITAGMATSIAGSIRLQGNSLVINESLASTGGGSISLVTNSLSIGAGKTLTSSGNLIIQPIAAGTSIGLAGGPGALGITAANFSTNFTDGFAEIQIGSSSAGDITLGSPLTAMDNLRLMTASNLVLTNRLTLADNDCYFAGNNIVAGLTNYLVTNGIGKLRMDIAHNGSRTFPVGTTYYNPVSIVNHTGSPDQFYATVSNGVYQNGSTSGTPVPWTPRTNLTWNIGNTAASTGAGTVDLDFTWNAANELGTFTNPKMLHYVPAGWSMVGGFDNYNSSNRTLNHAGYSGSFSPFTIGESNALLPVTWLNFSGLRKEGRVDLDWATALETHNAFFEVERSDPNLHFSAIGKVAAAGGNGGGHSYQYSDHQPLDSRSYYRLKQVSSDGSISYSKIISIDGKNSGGFSVFSMADSNNYTLPCRQEQAGALMFLYTMSRAGYCFTSAAWWAAADIHFGYCYPWVVSCPDHGWRSRCV